MELVSVVCPAEGYIVLGIVPAPCWGLGGFLHALIHIESVKVEEMVFRWMVLAVAAVSCC